MRDELIERMAREFGNWLRTLDLTDLAAEFLKSRAVFLRLEIKPRRQDAAEGETVPILKKK